MTPIAYRLNSLKLLFYTAWTTYPDDYCTLEVECKTDPTRSIVPGKPCYQPLSMSAFGGKADLADARSYVCF